MTLLNLFLLSWAIVAFVMGMAWWVARKLDNYSIVDAVWALSFSFLSPMIIVLSPGYPLRKIVLGSLFLIWSVRLGMYLAVRIFGHLEVEDGRYVKLRAEYGNRLAFRFFLFFQMQALSVAFLLLPLFIAAQNTSDLLHPFEVFGIVFFFVGLIGETVSDGQLKRFVRKPENKGKVCDVGLWKYSRHPNYFFEAVIWVGYGVFACGSPNGAWALTTTAVMWLLLLKVTGVPMSEEQNLRSKPDAYREYQRRTNIFFPGPRRSG